MILPWKTQYIRSNQNDPMDIDNGLYVSILKDMSRILVRLDIPAEANAETFPHYRSLYDQFENTFFNFGQREEISFFLGGKEISEALFMLHENGMKIEGGFEISKPLICMSTLPDIVAQIEGQRIPCLWKLFFGYTLIDEDEVQANLKSGNWSEFTAPSYYAYGRKTEKLAEIAFRNRSMDASLAPSLRQAVRFGRDLKSIGLETQLSVVRSGLKMHYHANKSEFNDETIEKIIEIHLAVLNQDQQEVTEIFVDLSEDEFLEKHLSLSKRMATLPLLKENARLRKVFHDIGVNRYAYDFALFQDITKDVNSSPDASGLKWLERKMELISDIVTDEDRQDL